MPTISSDYQNAEWGVLCSALEKPERLYELRRDGHDIASEPFKTPGGATVSRYRMIREPQMTLTL